MVTWLNKKEYPWDNTVKASNFEPDVNFGLFHRGACYHQKSSYRKVKKMKTVDTL